MRFFCGIPFSYNIFIFIDNLNMCTFQFFAISDIYFADFDRSLAVFYQKSSIIRNSCLCIIFVYSSVFFQSKCSITCYCISIRSYRLTKCILLIGLETCNFVCFPCRIPLINDASIFVKYLDVSSSQFFMICDIYFTYFDRSDRVNKVISIYRCNISRNCIFAYCVNDFFSCCVFRKFCKLISPVAVCCYFLTACFFSVCEKSYCNAFRTFCCLVIVIPGLGSLYADCLCFMSICKDKSFCCCSCYNCFITNRYFCFSYCVNNVLSIFLRVKFAPCVCPVVVRTQSYFFALCCLTSIKLYFNVLRSDSILVVIICPCLSYGDAGLSWFVAVGDRCSVDCCCVICNSIFCYGINDFFTICILRKICEVICPVVCCGYIFCCYFCSISKKSYFDALRTFSILVVCIIPYLLATYRCCFWCVSIDDIVFINLSCVISYFNFTDCIVDCCSIFVNRKIIKCVLPVCCCSYCLACIYSSVCKKIYGNAGRTFSILVVIIIPGLRSADGSNFWYMFIGQCC